MKGLVTTNGISSPAKQENLTDKYRKISTSTDSFMEICGLEVDNGEKGNQLGDQSSKNQKESERKGQQGTVITGMGSNYECGNQMNLFILFWPQLPHTQHTLRQRLKGVIRKGTTTITIAI